VETVATSREREQTVGSMKNAWLQPRPRFALVMVTLMFALLGVAILLNFFKSNASSPPNPNATSEPPVTKEGLTASDVGPQSESALNSTSRKYGEELRKASRELVDLRSQYTDAHPMVIAKVQEVDRLQQLASSASTQEVGALMASLPPVVVRTTPVSGARDV